MPTVDLHRPVLVEVQALTIRNGDDGISCHARIHVENNRFTRNKDALDYEGGGGVCRNNVFEKNGDDGIDLDDGCAVLIEDNVITNNDDDGIDAAGLHALRRAIAEARPAEDIGVDSHSPTSATSGLDLNGHSFAWASFAWALAASVPITRGHRRRRRASCCNDVRRHRRRAAAHPT